MLNRRLVALSAIALTVATLASGAAGAQPPDPGDDVAPPVTIAEPIVPGGGPVEVVHSWALAPAGSEDPTEAGNRPSLSYVADAGSVIDDAVTLYNYGNQQLTFRVYATDAFTADNGEFDLLPGSEPPADVGSWVTVAQEYITVDPGAQATIPITITIPDGASPGDHTGAVLASNDARSEGPDGDTVVLDRRTGTRLFLRVNGPLNPELAVEDLSTDYDPAVNPLAGSAQVTYTIANRGNVRLSGSSDVSVSGPFGLGEQTLPATDFPELLPGGSITVTADVDDVPAFGLAITTVRLEPDSIDDEELVASSTRGVTFAPPIAVILGLIAFAIVLFGLRAYRRHRSQGSGGETESGLVDDLGDPIDVVVDDGADSGDPARPEPQRT